MAIVWPCLLRSCVGSSGRDPGFPRSDEFVCDKRQAGLGSFCRLRVRLVSPSILLTMPLGA